MKKKQAVFDDLIADIIAVVKFLDDERISRLLHVIQKEQALRKEALNG